MVAVSNKLQVQVQEHPGKFSWMFLCSLIAFGDRAHPPSLISALLK
ncbi:MAG: hypothetical protein V7K76_14420 [Nostoc sp.]